MHVDIWTLVEYIIEQETNEKIRELIVSSSQRIDDLYRSTGKILMELFMLIFFP